MAQTIFPIAYADLLPGEFNKIASLADGRIVDVGGADGGNIHLQFYSADGAVLGGAITVAPNAGFPGTTASPTVAPLVGGGFVVAAVDGVPGYIAVRSFDANGNPTSNWVEVNYPPGNTSYATSGPSLVTAPDGGFYVSWYDNSQAGVITSVPEPPGGHTQVTSDLDAFGAKFSSTGSLQTSFHFQAQFGFAYSQASGASAVLGNGSVVTPYITATGWHNFPNGTFSEGAQVWASRNNANFLVADFSDTAQPGLAAPSSPIGSFPPGAVALAGGGFAITYEKNLPSAGSFDGNGAEVYARFYNASGIATSGEAPLINVPNSGAPVFLTPLRNGGFAMANTQFTSPSNPAPFEAGVTLSVFDASGTITKSFDILDPSQGISALYGLTTASDGSVYITYSGTHAGGPLTEHITNILALSVSQALAAYNANANLTPVAVEDTAANVAGNLNALQVLTAHGKLSSIALTDALGALSVSGAQLASDAATLTLITSVYNLIVTANGAPVTYALAGGVSGFSLSGEASAVINGNARFDTITLGSGNDTTQAGGGGSYIIGNGGNDVLIGGAGGGASGLGNTIYALGGNDYLQGGAGSPSDVLVATGAGNDTFYGGSGNNYIVGGTGKNIIVGGGGALNSLYGNGANGDYIVGGSGAGGSNVLVENGTGAAQLWGGPGDDYIVGGAGNDLLVGGASTNYLFGGAGDDVIYGGAGTNYIFPGAGNDFIWTNPVGVQSTGYIYEGAGTGVDTVADFTPGDGANHDVLVMTAASSGIASFADVQAKAFQAGVYTVLPISATDQVYLYNVQPFQLTGNDFIFT